ncbi:MAG: hypothetical protein KGJ02_01585 [Verrucomicrobiota bacterium]|nr:hypothetical protein [Verrucomicrobiota bacterium]
MNAIWNNCRDAVQWVRETSQEVSRQKAKVILVTSAVFTSAITLSAYKMGVGCLPGFAVGAFCSIACDIQLILMIRHGVATFRLERRLAREQLALEEGQAALRATHLSGLISRLPFSPQAA